MHKNMHYKNLIIDIFAVTFRKEGVDWNLTMVFQQLARYRHLPQGRCGLKYIDAERNIEIILSPSARKVWIEIYILSFQFLSAPVTFRKEGVDWNMIHDPSMTVYDVTFRKEGVDWNVTCYCKRAKKWFVTFRKEGVDWN